jgi:RNA polymerase sigma-70 factor, ECF subfamily
MHDASDRDLVLRVRGGDAEAFGDLVQRYQNSVYNVCYRLLAEPDAAQDQAQEAFIRAYQRLDRYDDSRPFGPWIHRVAANLCLNELARLPRPSVSLDDERDEPHVPLAADPAAEREQAETALALRAAINALPAHYRVVIELRHFQDLSYAEIAVDMDLPVSDVKSYLFRARKLLARELRPRQDD